MAQQKTPNLDLVLPYQSEPVEVNDINGNYTKIDTAYGNLSDKIEPVVGTGKAWMVNAELNNYTTTGTYYIGTGATVGGTSLGMQYGMLVVNSGRTDTVEQTFIVNGGKRYYR